MNFKTACQSLVPVLAFACGNGEPPTTSSVESPALIGKSQQKLVASDQSTNSFFGVDAKLQGDTLVVGAAAAAANFAPKSVGAYVYTRSPGGPWAETAKLVGNDVIAADSYGFGTALDGDTVLVGSLSDDATGFTNSGSAYVFLRSGTTWSQQAKLVPSDPANNLYFGEAIAVQGDTAVIGAPAMSLPGRAYVFTRNGTSWSELQKLPHTDASPADNYGRSVAIDGSAIIVGAWQQDNAASNSGGADIYRLVAGAWVFEHKLLPSDPIANGSFGFGVDLEGNRALVGSRFATNGTIATGAVYVFEKTGNTWSQTQKLVPSDGGADQFGYSVSLAQNHLLVGSVLHDGAAGNTGAAYLFELVGSSWQQSTKLLAQDGTADDRLGCAAALDQKTAVAGACFDNSQTGSAYAFELAESAGGNCAGAADCASGFCVDGVCCDTACGNDDPNDCMACSAAAGASANGTCTPLADNAACDDDNACTQTDSCASGACSGQSPVTCSASDECHDVGTCDPTNGVCSDPALPDGTACGLGTCESGACVAPDAGTGGTAGAAGAGGTGATGASGGSGATGGTGATGATGATGGSSTGGNAGAKPDAGAPKDDSGDDGGCGCRVADQSPSPGGAVALLALSFLLVRRRWGRA